jgi:hypothetical protein
MVVEHEQNRRTRVDVCGIWMDWFASPEGKARPG